MVESKSQRFILWDPKDGPYREMTDGILGKLSAGNVYIKVYAKYPGEKRPVDLDIGECIEGVGFSLSGERGFYDLYRVKDVPPHD